MWAVQDHSGRTEAADDHPSGRNLAFQDVARLYLPRMYAYGDAGTGSSQLLKQLLPPLFRQLFAVLEAIHNWSFIKPEYCPNNKVTYDAAFPGLIDADNQAWRGQ